MSRKNKKIFGETIKKDLTQKSFIEILIFDKSYDID